MKIVFVCTGNTCRSPMAKGLFESLLKKEKIKNISVDSCGLCAMAGDEASPNAITAAKELDADITSHRAKLFSSYMIEETDFFVCMTESHASILRRTVHDKKIVVLGGGITDPYGGSLEQYRQCAKQIKESLKNLLEIFRRNAMNNFKNVDYKNVEITNGFWSNLQKLNREVTIKSVYEQFSNTGRFEAFKCEWKEGMPQKPHIFWDSDVAKWMEGAAYIIKKSPDAQLEKIIDDLIDLIEKNQGEDGYFNIYFTVCEPDNRWTNRFAHELYCAGHLIEGAVAYYEATGKSKFLNCMRKYADYIEKVFKIEKSADFSTPGHEEIELALVRLYDCTGERRYLALSKYFIEARGAATSKEVIDEMNNIYAQDHVMCCEQHEAVGHAVRACYLYCGMADIAREYGDEKLFNACQDLMKNIAEKRMYITGGIGSTNSNEAFTIDYDLPNDTSYAETCAAISLAMFANRMSKCAVNSLYADTAERALYNGVLSGLSLSGDAFFYENAMEINLDDRKPEREKRHMPITQRVKVFSCSCCPPNLNRFIPSVGSMIYTYDDDTLFVNQYIANCSSFDMDGKEVEIKIETDYPNDGKVSLSAKNLNGKTVAIRIPSWCGKYTLSVDAQQKYTVENGYAFLKSSGDECTINFEMDMTPKWYASNPHVWANAGMVALQKGPVVYCTEAVDNCAELWRYRIDVNEPVSETVIDSLNVPALKTAAYILEETDELYTSSTLKMKKSPLTLIPYYAFANRGESSMRVWMIKA